MSSFFDLKTSKDKIKELNWQIYYDWQQTSKKADMFVSFVSYCQQWIIGTIVFSLLLFGINLYTNSTEAYMIKDRVYTIDITSIDDTYTDSAYSWYTVLAKLQSDKYKKIVVLRNNADVDLIEEQLEFFKHQEAIYLTDTALDKNVIKIILED